MRNLKECANKLCLVVLLFLAVEKGHGQKLEHGIKIHLGGMSSIVNLKGTVFSAYNQESLGKAEKLLLGQNVSIGYFWRRLDLVFNNALQQSVRSAESKHLDFSYRSYGITGGYSIPLNFTLLNELRPYVGLDIIYDSEVLFTDTHFGSLDSMKFGGKSVKFSSTDKSYYIPVGLSAVKYLGDAKYWNINAWLQMAIPTNPKLNPIFKASQFLSFGVGVSRRLYVGNRQN